MYQGLPILDCWADWLQRSFWNWLVITISCSPSAAKDFRCQAMSPGSLPNRLGKRLDSRRFADWCLTTIAQPIYRCVCGIHQQPSYDKTASDYKQGSGQDKRVEGGEIILAAIENAPAG